VTLFIAGYLLFSGRFNFEIDSMRWWRDISSAAPCTRIRAAIPEVIPGWENSVRMDWDGVSLGVYEVKDAGLLRPLGPVSDADFGSASELF
jgi:hypothetical protein